MHRPLTTDQPAPRAGTMRKAAQYAAAATAALTCSLLVTVPAVADDQGSTSGPEPGATAPSTPATGGATEPTSEPTSEPTPSEPTPSEEPTTEPTPDPTPEPEPTPAPEPFEPMKEGERSQRVRVLESRLHQLGLHSEVITSLFDDETRQGVVAFKRAQSLAGRAGVVDERTWERLVSLTRTPTEDELNNVYKPGPAILKKGMRSPKVRDLEARLAQANHFRGRVGPRFDRRTVRAVRSFQKATRIPVTGQVDARTQERLRAVTRRPTRGELRNWQFDLDDRCLTGRVMCIDKTTRSLKWVVNGTVRMRLDARFGDPYYPTREGLFRVFKKSRDHVSSIYNTPMPFAMFFSGGQAVHYSPDFKANGYDGTSHGCVNIRNRRAVEKLFDRVVLGDKVVVFRS